jgi:prepilin-type N-terminal cleavage/methylation domain-containing protein
MALSLPSNHRKARRGFTLIEILVVIGIILILMAILLPALGGARDRAYHAKSTALLTGISNNIETYFTTFDAYPGPAPAGPTDPNSGATTTGANKISGTQNLLMALSYSMYIVAPPPTNPSSAIRTFGSAPSSNSLVALGSSGVSVDIANAIGPSDLSNLDASVPASSKAKAYTAFYNPGAKEAALLKDNKGNPVGVPIPTIFDAWPDGLPILYFRRTPGSEGSIKYDSSYVGTQDSTNPIVREAPTAGPPPVLAPYYRSDNSEYLDASSLRSTSGTFYSQAKSGLTPAGPAANANLASLIAGKSASTTLNARGGFVLISAGSDRVYGQNADKNGKADDIVIVGGH